VTNIATDDSAGGYAQGIFGGFCRLWEKFKLNSNRISIPQPITKHDVATQAIQKTRAKTVK
jgi:hypothetical protein